MLQSASKGISTISPAHVRFVVVSIVFFSLLFSCFMFDCPDRETSPTGRGGRKWVGREFDESTNVQSPGRGIWSRQLNIHLGLWLTEHWILDQLSTVVNCICIHCMSSYHLYNLLSFPLPRLWRMRVLYICGVTVIIVLNGKFCIRILINSFHIKNMLFFYYEETTETKWSICSASLGCIERIILQWTHNAMAELKWKRKKEKWYTGSHTCAWRAERLFSLCMLHRCDVLFIRMHLKSQSAISL